MIIFIYDRRVVFYEEKKNGFTLVELLVTIVLLGVVTTVIIFNVTNISKIQRKQNMKGL